MHSYFKDDALERNESLGFHTVRDPLRVALDASTEHVRIVTGGLEASKSFPFVRRYLVTLQPAAA
jgi:hypothetical protein